ncbi:DEAD/SNF2-like helicase [Catovirus CTV1]|uniref:DEAD/SNF2-like helicase n=1 Tax=Catovirus CTV1 TaxID=1977631 RepID=A0A1V0SBK0_9VIRU|nr:DEAD/SNF2-like helicase [Catovirus CTV1]
MDKKLLEYNKILKEYFGYDSLKQEQYEIIDKVINKKKDVMALLSTGFGKSLCFQLPFLITGKCVIVISPLISLMKDQQSQMEKIGIPVCVLNNTNKNKTGDKLEILNGVSKIIYITPEYLEYCDDFIVDLADNDMLCLMVIDEAHCISTYGSDFRKSYTRLNVLKEWAPEIPVLALTATASKKVRSDILKVLKIPKAHIVIGSFDRPNLYIEVKQKTKNIGKDIEGLLEKYKDEYVIIYCKTRDDTDKITEIVNDLGIESLAYHAGLNTSSRDDVQNQFIEGTVKCIVATVAFGMGINIRSIRCVIHYGCPKNIESYYQEIGRAGRDGQPAECHMFYSAKDFIQNRHFLNQIKNETYKAYQAEQIQNINKYVYTNECRRLLLLKSFDEELKTNECGNCDNCLKKNKAEKFDFTIAAHQLLTLAVKFDGKCGGTFLINILRGSNAKNISELTKKNKLYGIGKNQSVDWWKAVIRILINNDYIRETCFGKYGTTLKCSDKGKKWLSLVGTDSKKVNDKNKILLSISDDFRKFVKSSDIIEDKKSNSSDNTKLTEDKKKESIENKKKGKVIIEKSKPSNAGKKWSNEEEKKLLEDIKNKTINEIAEKCDRTVGAIRSRLAYVAWKLYKNNLPMSEISRITKLTDDKILKIVDLYKGSK